MNHLRFSIEDCRLETPGGVVRDKPVAPVGSRQSKIENRKSKIGLASFFILVFLFVPVRADDAGKKPVAADDQAGKPVAVPFELLKTGHMTTMIKVNGKGPYRVIFDTGSPVTVLNNKIAKEAGLLENTPKPSYTLIGSMALVTVKELEAGTLKAEKVDALVMDHPTVAALARALGPIDGIVGFPFFARYKMTLDYQKKEMTFLPSGYQPPDVVQAVMARLAALTNEKGQPVKVVAAAAQWGIVVRKERGDDEAGVTIKEVFPGMPRRLRA